MYIVEVLTAGLAATALMSFYMFLVSLFSGKEYRVPFVLGSMLSEKSTAGNLMDYTLVARMKGTVVHYAVGLVFALGYLFLWNRGWLSRSVSGALLFGAFSGLIGIMVWRLFFKVHSFPVKLNLPKYLFHLFLAHLVFALALVGVLFLLTEDVRINGEPYHSASYYPFFPNELKSIS